MFLQDQKTTLHYAARNGNEDVVMLLLEKGLDVNVVDKVSKFVDYMASPLETYLCVYFSIFKPFLTI